MRPWIVPAAAALLLAALPAVLTPYTQDLVVKIAIYAVFALSLELLVGTSSRGRDLQSARFRVR